MITCKPNVFFNLTISSPPQSLFNPLSERSKTAIISNNKEWKLEGTEIQGTQKITGKRRRKDNVPVNTTTKSKRKKDVFHFFEDLAKDIKIDVVQLVVEIENAQLTLRNYRLWGVQATGFSSRTPLNHKKSCPGLAQEYGMLEHAPMRAVDALPPAEDSTVIGITVASSDSVDPDVVVFCTQKTITPIIADEDYVHSDIAGLSKRAKRNREIHEDPAICRLKKGKSYTMGTTLESPQNKGVRLC
ncbi:uncharacterized protein C8R40DRAFT_1263178 [Lentinula edodes]|uniref:uncharacterized protein n=1 Tax=Lentinula edodes TaxID=5353 RepID=UPI001E8D338F|nr:uncharacterized protein C8R40DRAFT_1263178 [Lentinula edodes]KAH7879048.1 hypothetical protein C8R40DRAFT_1263178 [Lentinula edodes]